MFDEQNFLGRKLVKIVSEKLQQKYTHSNSEML